MTPIPEGALVCLVDPKGARLLVRAHRGAARVPALGVVDLGAIVGAPWGGEVAFGPRAFRALPPSTLDLALTVERKAQIVLPKDAAHIRFHADVRAGRRVLESGAGSGALTVALAAAVAPTGRVTTVEVREDFLEHARRNLERAGLSEFVEFVLGDVARDPPTGPFDVAVLDIPNPEDAIPAVAERLVGGGHLACYTPLVSQAEAARRAIERAGLAGARTVEVLERELVVGERGSRPAHDMLAHTAYLTYARRVA